VAAEPAVLLGPGAVRHRDRRRPDRDRPAM